MFNALHNHMILVVLSTGPIIEIVTFSLVTACAKVPIPAYQGNDFLASGSKILNERSCAFENYGVLQVIEGIGRKRVSDVEESPCQDIIVDEPVK